MTVMTDGDYPVEPSAGGDESGRFAVERRGCKAGRTDQPEPAPIGQKRHEPAVKEAWLARYTEPRMIEMAARAKALAVRHRPGGADDTNDV